jgi:ubiquinone/menaquinone biosynthesis C-methylase UbiE
MTSGYERRVGRYGPELSEAMIEAAGVAAGQRILDLGCGSGALTMPLAEIVGAENVVGADPDPDALQVCAERVPGAELIQAWAEDLPLPDHAFDVGLAQLVLGLLDDGEAAVREMHRVTRAGGIVAACVWDFREGMTALRTFWDAALAIDPEGAAEHDQATTRPYSSPHELEALWLLAGFADVETRSLSAGSTYADFDDYWEPMTVPDGGPGRYYADLTKEQGDALRNELHRRLGQPSGPFRLEARAWFVRGNA